MGKVVVAARLPGRIDEILAGHTVVGPRAGEAELSRARLVEELRDADGLLALLEAPRRRRAPRRRTPAARRRQLRRRLRQRRSRRHAPARHRRHQHAGRAHRRHRRPDAGAHARGRAPPARGRGDDPRRALARLGAGAAARPSISTAPRSASSGSAASARPWRAARAASACASSTRSRARRRPTSPSRSPRATSPLDELLAAADIVTLHCPLSPATRHLMNAARLAAHEAARDPRQHRARRRSSTKRRSSRRSSAGSSSASASTSSRTSRACTRGLVACPRAVLLPHLGSATRRRAHGDGRDRGALDRRRARRPPPAHVVGGGA